MKERYSVWHNTKEAIVKKCLICGDEFKTDNGNYRYCCQECGNIATKLRSDRYNKANKERIRDNTRRRERKNAHRIKCKICEETVEREILPSGRISYRRYHEECVVNEAIKKLKQGYGIHNTKEVKRAYNRFGYSVEELRKIMKEKE